MPKGIEALSAIRKQIPEDKSITLVGGVFDLLHPGHLHVIDHAKGLGDVLVVSVLPDHHVKSYKGEKRPILPEDHRLTMVKALKSVDHAFISDASSYSRENLETLKPNNLVFGMEDNEARIKKVGNQKAIIKSEFPNITSHDLARYQDDPISTSALVEKIKKL